MNEASVASSVVSVRGLRAACIDFVGRERGPLNKKTTSRIQEPQKITVLDIRDVVFPLRAIGAKSVRLQWCYDREVQLLSRHTLSGLSPTVTAPSRDGVGNNQRGVTSP